MVEGRVTSVRVRDELLRDARILAIREGLTFRALVEELLEAAVGGDRIARSVKRRSDDDIVEARAEDLGEVADSLAPTLGCNSYIGPSLQEKGGYPPNLRVEEYKEGFIVLISRKSFSKMKPNIGGKVYLLFKASSSRLIYEMSKRVHFLYSISNSSWVVGFLFALSGAGRVILGVRLGLLFGFRLSFAILRGLMVVGGLSMGVVLCYSWLRNVTPSFSSLGSTGSISFSTLVNMGVALVSMAVAMT